MQYTWEKDDPISMEGDFAFADKIVNSQYYKDESLEGPVGDALPGRGTMEFFAQVVVPNLLYHTKTNKAVQYFWAVEILWMILIVVAVVLELTHRCQFTYAMLPVCQRCYSTVFILWFLGFNLVWSFQLYLYLLLKSRGFKFSWFTYAPDPKNNPVNILVNGYYEENGPGGEKNYYYDAADNNVFDRDSQKIQQQQGYQGERVGLLNGAVAQDSAFAPDGAIFPGNSNGGGRTSAGGSAYSGPEKPVHLFNFVTALLYFTFFVGWTLFFQSNGACARNRFASRLGGDPEAEPDSRSNIMLLMMLFTLLGFIFKISRY